MNVQQSESQQKITASGIVAGGRKQMLTPIDFFGCRKTVEKSSCPKTFVRTVKIYNCWKIATSCTIHFLTHNANDNNI